MDPEAYATHARKAVVCAWIGHQGDESLILRAHGALRIKPFLLNNMLVAHD
jgi:hypothetical protein